jgi:hypothetical protein
MDLRKPGRDWRKNPPSVRSVLALLALAFLGGGVATSQGVDGPSDTLSNVLFGAGMAIALILVVVHVAGMRDGDPRKKRLDVD